jgi:predicted amidohydrolase YtcJ
VRTRKKYQILLHSGRVRTLNDENPLAEAILIEGDQIIGVGNDREMDDLAIPTTARVDLAGKTVLPGLCDAHIHLEKYAQSLDLVDCETDTLEECLQNIHSRASQTPIGQWIRGHGWNQNRWSRFGTTQDLDRVAPHHPVYLTAKSLHAGWANSLALRNCGVTTETRSPDGGSIQKNSNGDLTGILFEAAMKLIQDKIPPPSIEDLVETMLAAQDSLWRVGITTLHDFDGATCFQALQIMRERKKLGLRVVKNVRTEEVEHAIGLGLRTGFGDQWIRIGSLKYFADGALGPHTAAMFEPYDGEANNYGILFLDQEQLFEIAVQAVENGFSIAVHAIGDRANHEMLDAFERLRHYERTEGLPPLRHRLEHLQVMHPNDLQRAAECDIIASMQPIHATSDMDAANRYWSDRVQYAYAWRSQIDAGATLAFGSDAPVESPNPFWGIHAAVTRQRLDGSPGKKGWIPDQRLSLLEALHGYTRGPAYAAGMETLLGELSPHRLADLIVLQTDPFELPVQDLAELSPLGTMVAGIWRYKAFD